MDNIGLKNKYCSLKMNNKTVKQLKAIPKERGRRGYYKLRKAELINALEAPRLVEQKRNIFDEPIRMIPLQFYNHHLGNHQISLQKASKIQNNSLQKVCKRLKILVNGC